ncbi:lectin-like [Carica papaya]|uniref:lectin-like n=1 Tax=Carica papaya TaxID=3649 RepID=UPI000B8CC703|nr:lectin-like [Carica papaya]
MGTNWSQGEAPEFEPRGRVLQIHVESQNYDTEAKVEEKTVEKNLPHSFEGIIKNSDSDIDRSSVKKLYDQLHAGVFLNQKRKRYWVDKKSNKNCFMVLSRGLAITWAEDARFWHWQNLKDTTTDEVIEVAELLNVCWLEVCGKFEIEKLSPATLYEVVFVIMLKDATAAYGWEIPVNLSLSLPDGSKFNCRESLMTKPRCQWIEIPIGEFTTSTQNVGNITFSMYEHEGGKWKRGLVIKGIAIRPKD